MEGTCLRLRQNQPQLARRCPLALALALPLVLALDLALAQRVAQFRKDIFQFSIRANTCIWSLLVAQSTDSQCGRTSQNPTYRSSKRKSLRWIGTFACLFRQDLAILQTNMATSMVPLSIMTCPDRRFRDFWTFDWFVFFSSRGRLRLRKPEDPMACGSSLRSARRETKVPGSECEPNAAGHWRKSFSTCGHRHFRALAQGCTRSHDLNDGSQCLSQDWDALQLKIIMKNVPQTPMKAVRVQTTLCHV